MDDITYKEFRDIPEAPNYAINRVGTVINKKTGYILKTHGEYGTVNVTRENNLPRTIVTTSILKKVFPELFHKNDRIKPINKDALIYMFKKTKDIKATAKEFGVSTSHVSAIITEYFKSGKIKLIDNIIKMENRWKIVTFPS